jgi:hypothetical protein
MNSTIRPESPALTPLTSGFVLSAAITILFNTGLAWAKDLSPRLNGFMKSLSGHHWTTHGLIDLVLFIGFGLIFTNTSLSEKIDPKRLTAALTVSVVMAALGLGIWYVFV